MSFMDIKEEEIEVVRGSYPFKERSGGTARHSLRYILGDLQDIKQKYFMLGFHLNEFAEYNYYKDFGYESMKEFCLANIPLDYSALSRCMSVHTHTCERVEGKPWKKTNRMKEKYREYGYSQLVEMLGMNNEQEKQCSPAMTIKEIRELKKQSKKKHNQEDSKKNSQEEETDNCDVAINESKKDSCDVATTGNENNNVEEMTKEISKNEKQEKAKHVINSVSAFDKEMAYKTFMEDKYKEYGYSQLVEMAGMDEEEEKLCTPDMTVKQIRELKKQIKEVKKDNPYHFTADKFKDAIIKIKKGDNCDVAITENEKDSTEETTTELSENEKQEENNPSFNHPSFFKTFVNRPSDVVLSMFKRHFGEGLKAEPRGKMLEIEIPGYKVTIRISFKELEETEE